MDFNLFGLYNCVIVFVSDIIIEKLLSKITLHMLQDLMLESPIEEELLGELDEEEIKMSGNEVISIDNDNYNADDSIIRNPKMIRLIDDKNKITNEHIKLLNRLNAYESLSFSGKRDKIINPKRVLSASQIFGKYLNLEKLDSWVFDYNFWFSDIRKWIKEIIKSVKTHIKFDEKSLIVNISDEIPLLIFIDCVRLQQIIKNLLWLIYNCWNSQIIHLYISEEVSERDNVGELWVANNHIVFELYSSINIDYKKNIINVINYSFQNIHNMDDVIFGLYIADVLIRGLDSKLKLIIEESWLKISFKIKLSSGDSFKTWLGSTLEHSPKFSWRDFDLTDDTIADESMYKFPSRKFTTINLPYTTQLTKQMSLTFPNSSKISKRTIFKRFDLNTIDKCWKSKTISY